MTTNQPERGRRTGTAPTRRPYPPSERERMIRQASFWAFHAEALARPSLGAMFLAMAEEGSVLVLDNRPPTGPIETR